MCRLQSKPDAERHRPPSTYDVPPASDQHLLGNACGTPSTDVPQEALKCLSVAVADLPDFEAERKVSIMSFLGWWSGSAEGDVVCLMPLEALRGLDPVFVLRTCLGLPRWRYTDATRSTPGASPDSDHVMG